MEWPAALREQPKKYFPQRFTEVHRVENSDVAGEAAARLAEG